eukprot:364362-Chlamydomonas_euryale.AAC.11
MTAVRGTWLACGVVCCVNRHGTGPIALRAHVSIKRRERVAVGIVQEVLAHDAVHELRAERHALDGRGTCRALLNY